jgi:prolyl-tRNA synthetase
MHVTPGVDFQTEYADLREVQQGDNCPVCGSPLCLEKAIYVATCERSKFESTPVLTPDGSAQGPWIGHYRIAVEHILACIVEQSHDELGLVWPRSVAPFQVVVTLLRRDDPNMVTYAEELHSRLEHESVDCLLDDRDERPGVKFRDAELIGIPARITLGKKFAEGNVEVFDRASKRQVTVALDKAVETVMGVLEEFPL